MIRTLLLTIAMLMGLAGVAYAEPPGELPRAEIIVSFDLKAGQMRGISKITLPAGRSWAVSLAGLDIESASYKGGNLLKSLKPGDMLNLQGGGTLEVLYVKKAQEGNARISPDAVALTSQWHPVVAGGLARYSLKALLPEGLTAISEADDIRVRTVAGGVEHDFLFPYPVDHLSLVAARYEETSLQVGDVRVAAYFFSEDRDLAQGYLESATKYVAMYTQMLGPFPFKRFSVVENIDPTGYSMPTYTLLGQQVVRLPFITDTSLGHEVLHQWYGNCVYSDYETGNWSEGLVTYLADHFYEEQKAAGHQYRKRSLMDYRNYTSGGRDFPLTEFTVREDFKTRAVGYGKALMVFHQLRMELGNELFVTGLREIVRARAFEISTWDDLRVVFERAGGKDLTDFFSQWVTRKGIPELELVGEPLVTLKAGLPTVSFVLKQTSDEPYNLLVPVTFYTRGGMEHTVVRVTKAKETVRVNLKADPLSMVIDEQYDVMRALSDSETPPVISALTGAEKRVAVVHAKDKEAYTSLIKYLEDAGFAIKTDEDIKLEDLYDASALFVGLDYAILKRLVGGAQPAPAKDAAPGVSFVAIPNPMNPGSVIAALNFTGNFNDTEAMLAAARKLPRYGSYSVLQFDAGGKVVNKATLSADEGIRVELAHEMSAVRPARAMNFSEVMDEALAGAQVIYVGESHTNYQDHKVQLAAIRHMYEKGVPFAIGMEMFQAPWQEALDDYIAGKTQEREFLVKSEYFKRWSFNYYLYREIIDYARAKGIPVIALNQNEEVIKKVSRGGLDSLSNDDLKLVPEGMDFTNEQYKGFLQDVFGQHDNNSNKSFNKFYQAQVLWDETMASNVHQYLTDHPDRKVLVIAGQGHIAYGHGIPSRVARRTSLPYRIILNASTDLYDKDMADYIVFAAPVEAPEYPTLGIALDEKDPARGLMVTEVKDGSPGQKAGLRKDDIVLAADGVEVKSIGELKALLLDKQEGDSVKLQIKRPRFLLGPKAMELTATF